MVIHRIKESQTLSDIAALYGVDEDILRMNNGLETGDIPTVGEELLVLYPTRTYVVAKGDSIERLALRFGVLRRELSANNPIIEREGLVPGRRLALKYGDRPFGQIATNGYYLHQGNLSVLQERLPHLTYVTVGAARYDGKRLVRIFDGREAVGLVKMADKIPLLRIYGTGYSQIAKDYAEQLIDSMLDMASSGGYKGITLGGELLSDEMMLMLKKKSLGCDLILLCEVDFNTSERVCEIADGTVFSGSSPVSESNRYIAELERFSSMRESNRTLPELCSFAQNEGRFIPISEALQAARRGSCKIEFDKDLGVCTFTHKKFGEFVYPSLENIKATLEALYEYGYMGLSFDIMSIPTQHLMLIRSVFGRTL